MVHVKPFKKHHLGGTPGNDAFKALQAHRKKHASGEQVIRRRTRDGKLILANYSGLIGDFLGTIPVMIDLARRESVEVVISDYREDLLELIPKKYGIVRSYAEPNEYMDLHKAFAYSHLRSVHMTQAYHHMFGLPTPSGPIRPELVIPECCDVYDIDYVLAPFSRSLPTNQRWQHEKWIAIVDLFPSNKFAVVGNSNFDPKGYIPRDNVVDMFDYPLVNVAQLLQQCRKGCISVVNGISHYCFALGVKNYLLFGQGGKWGLNPHADAVHKQVDKISVDDVVGRLDLCIKT